MTRKRRWPLGAPCGAPSGHLTINLGRKPSAQFESAMTARATAAGTIAASVTTRRAVACRRFAGRAKIAEFTAKLIVESIFEAHGDGRRIAWARTWAASRPAISAICAISAIGAWCTLAAALC